MKDAAVAASQQQMVVELMEAELRISNVFPPHCHAMTTSTSCVSCVQPKHSPADEVVCAHTTDE